MKKAFLILALAAFCGDGIAPQNANAQQFEGKKVVSTKIFKIQLGAFKAPNVGDYNSLNQLGKKIYIEQAGNNLKKVMLGDFNDETEARSTLASVKKLGYGDAFLSFHESTITDMITTEPATQGQSQTTITTTTVTKTTEPVTKMTVGAPGAAPAIPATPTTPIANNIPAPHPAAVAKTRPVTESTTVTSSTVSSPSMKSVPAKTGSTFYDAPPILIATPKSPNSTLPPAFIVQIGAFAEVAPDDFKSLADLGDIFAEYDAGVTRITLGTFNSRKEAEGAMKIMNERGFGSGLVRVVDTSYGEKKTNPGAAFSSN